MAHRGIFLLLFAAALFAATEHAEYARFEPLYRQAVHVREQKFGADAPRGAKSRTNLGWLLRTAGNAAAAEPE
ncbi:MAG: hypothetical protein ACRD9L_06185, partial [Bryobacteraceae bacterium]